MAGLTVVDGTPPGLPSCKGRTVIAKTKTTSHGALDMNSNTFLHTSGLGVGAMLTARAPSNDEPKEFGGGHASPVLPTHGTPIAQPNQGPGQPKATGKTGLKTRANIKITTPNMKGRKARGQSKTLGNGRTNKWKAVAHTMKSQRIGILALQETHLTDQDIEEVKQTHRKWALVFNLTDRERPGRSAGVAFVINKGLVLIKDVKYKELIPGRASVLTVKWHMNKTITLINVYGPTEEGQQVGFWPKVCEEWEKVQGWLKVDFILGDFNIVKEEFDRAPPKANNKEEVTALRDFQTKLNTTDAWRNTFPTQNRFTFQSHIRKGQDRDNVSCSRIDCIYVNADSKEMVYKWNAPTTVLLLVTWPVASSLWHASCVCDT
jgi:exonuclease III